MNISSSSMDSSKLFFLSSPKPCSSTPLSLLLSYQSSSSSFLLVKPKFSSSLRTHVSSIPIPIPTRRNAFKSSFFGQSLILKKEVEFSNLRKTQTPSRRLIITAAVKRRKEMPFDNVIQRDKKLKLVLKLRTILVSQPDRTMALRELGRHRKILGLTRSRRFIALLKRFPRVFKIEEKGAYSLRFRLTPEAEEVYLEELKLRNDMEGLLVTKLRKLLMMSLEKRIPIEKIAHLRSDFGLPMDFRDTLCQRYPQYFKVVRTDKGPALELTHWDPELAISAAELAEEEKREREIEERNLIIDRPPRFSVVKLPKGLKLTRKETARLTKFKEIPYISPYSDFSGIKAGTIQKEKHAIAVVHEMLSLCIEKRTLVDILTHFREEFRFSQQLRGMLIRHPDVFYVSLKGQRDSVFLREAYHKSQLIEKDRLLILKEKMRYLVNIPRFTKKGAPRAGEGDDDDENEEDADGSEEGTEDEEDWSDLDGMLKDEKEDGEDEGEDDEGEDEDDWSDIDDEEDEGEHEDDWSDIDDETPPDFDDGDGSSSTEQQSKPYKRVEKSRNDGDKVLPVYPDGRPRERW